MKQFALKCVITYTFNKNFISDNFRIPIERKTTIISLNNLKTNNMTAVEWLQESLSIHFSFEQKMQFEGLFQQAKEMEKQKQNELAIGFAEWIDCRYYQGEDFNEYHTSINEYRDGMHFTATELLEIYKKEKGL